MRTEQELIDALGHPWVSGSYSIIRDAITELVVARQEIERLKQRNERLRTFVKGVRLAMGMIIDSDEQVVARVGQIGQQLAEAEDTMRILSLRKLEAQEERDEFLRDAAGERQVAMNLRRQLADAQAKADKAVADVAILARALRLFVSAAKNEQSRARLEGLAEDGPRSTIWKGLQIMGEKALESTPLAEEHLKQDEAIRTAAQAVVDAYGALEKRAGHRDPEISRWIKLSLIETLRDALNAGTQQALAAEHLRQDAERDEVLRWYGDESNYKTERIWDDNYTMWMDGDVPVGQDRGARARRARGEKEE